MTQLLRSAVIGLAGGLLLALPAAALALASDTSLATAISLALAFAGGITLLHYWKTLQAQMHYQGLAQLHHRLDRIAEQIAETQGLVQLTPYEHPYPMPFGGGWALTADAAALLAREVALNRPHIIVELGSGVSSVLLGRLLKEMGEGKVYSLDHDANWAEQTRRHVRASGIAEYVEVLDAPLSRQRFADHEYDWYTVPEAVRRLPAIDLLIVDGPPAALEPEGTPRYPALPAFLAQLSPQAVIYVDDAKRPQEQAMLARWLQENPAFEQRMHDTVPGTCLLRRDIYRANQP